MTGRALCAFGYIHEAVTVTISSVGAQKLSAEASTGRAVAAGWTANRSGGVMKAEASRCAGLRKM